MTKNQTLGLIALWGCLTFILSYGALIHAIIFIYLRDGWDEWYRIPLSVICVVTAFMTAHWTVEEVNNFRRL